MLPHPIRNVGGSDANTWSSDLQGCFGIDDDNTTTAVPSLPRSSFVISA
jgi:hypothetical protein